MILGHPPSIASTATMMHLNLSSRRVARTANTSTGAEEMGSSTTSTLDRGYVSISEVCVAGARSVPAPGRAGMTRGMSRMKTTMATSSTSVWVTTTRGAMSNAAGKASTRGKTTSELRVEASWVSFRG